MMKGKDPMETLLEGEQEPADPALGPVPRTPEVPVDPEHYDMHVPDITEGDDQE